MTLNSRCLTGLFVSTPKLASSFKQLPHHHTPRFVPFFSAEAYYDPHLSCQLLSSTVETNNTRLSQQLVFLTAPDDQRRQPHSLCSLTLAKLQKHLY